jgi:hypothetical protein
LNLTADTNVLVRAVVGDDPQQSAVASAALRQADAIAVPLPVLCEAAHTSRCGLLQLRGQGGSAIACHC